MATLVRMPADDRARDGGATDRPRKMLLQTHYYAFLSYSHEDKDVADWLHRELEEFRVPHALAGKLTANGVVPKRLAPVFRDQHELAAADDLGEEIREALARSQFLVVLCSPAAARSRWANAEIETFKRTRPDGCVLAAVVAGEPFASEVRGREAEECFPPALRQKYDRRGRPTGKRAEPLAADMREAGDGRRLGFLKLVAGMLGVGLDDLVQREATRRHRRLAWLAAASLAGMAVTSTLAITAIQARNSAREQRREAEGLVAFMVGDLKDKLEPIGRLDALDGVGSRVLAYYSKQDASELSDAALLQRSQALSLTAQVTYLRGDLDAALHLYHEALAGTAEAVRRSPDDPQRLFDHAQNVFWIGELARKRGRVSRAEAAFREYKRLADRMVSLAPDNLKWRMEVAYAKSNVGITLYLQRRFAEAAQLFAEAATTSGSLAAVDPRSNEYARALANQLAWLADAQAALGRLGPAIEARKRQIALIEQLLADDRRDVRLGEYLIPAEQGLGILLASRGDSEAAIEQLKQAVAESERLMQAEPENAIWRGLGAAPRLDLARTLLALGRTDEAVRQTAAGCGLAADFVKRANNVVKGATLRTACLSMRSRLALAAGADNEALALAQRALASARTESSGDLIADPRYSIAAAYRLLGDVQQRMGNTDAARTAWNAGLAELPGNFAERPREMNEHAQLLRRLGRTGESGPLVDRLAAMGFRSQT